MWLGMVHSCSRSTCQSLGLCAGRAAHGAEPQAAEPPDPTRPTPRRGPHLHVGVLLGGQVEDPAWVVVQPLQQVIQTEPALADCCQQQRQHGLQPREAGGRPGPTLLLQGVGGWGEREQHRQADQLHVREVTRATGTALPHQPRCSSLPVMWKTGKPGRLPSFGDHSLYPPSLIYNFTHLPISSFREYLSSTRHSPGAVLHRSSLSPCGGRRP